MSAATAEKSVATVKKSVKATKKAIKKTEEVPAPILKKAPGEEFVTVGRRKCSVAKVRLSRGNGVWLINGKLVDKISYEYDEKGRHDAEPVDISYALRLHHLRGKTGPACGRARTVISLPERCRGA